MTDPTASPAFDCSPHALRQPRRWTREGYFVSTDVSLIPISEVNAMFASERFYWASALPDDVMLATLQNSLCFGLYKGTHEPDTIVQDDHEKSEHAVEFIGFARCITDFSTFAYLTDVFVLPQHQGGGLGKWLIKCVSEVLESMPHLRRSLLFTSDWKRSVPFYEQIMGMSVLGGRAEGVDVGTRSGGSEDGVQKMIAVGPAIMERKGPGHPEFQR